MSKQEFLDTLVNELQQALGADFRISVDDIRKNNNVFLKAIIVKKNDETIAPVIYMDELYSSYLNGKGMEQLVAQIQEKVESSDHSKGFPMGKLKDFEVVKNMIVLQVINYNKNANLLKEIPHTRYLDLAVIFRVVLSSQNGFLASVVVTEYLLGQWGTTANDLYKIGLSNSARLLPAYDTRLESMLFGWDEKEVDEYLDSGSKLYILTNAQGVNGATSFLYPNVLKTISNKFESDLVILPSSVHEVLYLPYIDDIDLHELGKMVQIVNKNDVGEEEILSDNIYLYRRDEDILELVENN